MANPKLKFMEQCREVMRFRRLALRSEQAYLDWIKRFIFFHDKRHPKDMGGAACGQPLPKAEKAVWRTGCL